MSRVLKVAGTGVQFQPQSAQDLAIAIRQLQSSSELCKNMGARGKERFQGLFHIDHSAKKVAQVYDEVIKSSAV